MELTKCLEQGLAKLGGAGGMDWPVKGPLWGEHLVPGGRSTRLLWIPGGLEPRKTAGRHLDHSHLSATRI